MLEIDPSRRTVVGHVKASEQERSADEQFEEGLDRVRRAGEEQSAKYEAAREQERKRKERLASLFDDATKKVGEQEDREEPPQRFWD